MLGVDEDDAVGLGCRVMVLMSEGFRRAARDITIFIESSRLRDHITRVIDIFRRIYEAHHGGTCIIHIKSLQVSSWSLSHCTYVRLEKFINVSITRGDCRIYKTGFILNGSFPARS